ncbi:alpha/beta-hydrolase [Amylocystis lapponica]|nr:alpha/beta-hydrolase [Amylocystis lapponica]
MSSTNVSKWDKYGRLSLDFASTATSIGFSAAKVGTQLGFSVTRGIASTAAGITGSVVDHVLFGGNIGAGPLLGGAVSTAISTIESIALAPILLGETITSTSLVAAQSSLSSVSTIFPGSDEASFSLASFVGLVRREWAEPAESESLPEERFGISKILKALAGWATLQGVTSEWQEGQWFKYMREMDVNDEPQLANAPPAENGLRTWLEDDWVHITADVIYPSHSGQIVTADLGEAASASFVPTRATSSNLQPSPSPSVSAAKSSMSNAELKQTLRRLSKMVLAGYGGPGLLFFGVSLSSLSSAGVSSPLSSSEKEKQKEEMKLADAVGASEADASASNSSTSAHVDDTPSGPGKSSYSWWNVLMGKHDRDIFLNYANSQPHTPPAEVDDSHPVRPKLPPRPSTASVGSDALMPRFWVLTDHARHEVVLVIRGTMSLNEVAVDLTCDTAPFELVSSRPRSHSRRRSRSHARADSEKRAAHEREDSSLQEELESIPGSFPMDPSTPSPKDQTRARPKPPPSAAPSQSEDIRDGEHLVHGGMLKMAREMGGPGKPVHVAVRDALRRNHGYSLVLCGHSLGAGVAGLLALMWADPQTRLTHRASGLPARRPVSAYCFAPPCIASPQLAAAAGASGLITSFVYAHDVVARLSLGSVRDLTRAAAWLCDAEGRGAEGYSGVTRRALRWKAGFGEDGDAEWFVAMRKTLEANMHMVQLYPPGRVFWALRDGELQPAHRLEAGREGGKGGEKVRLFEVLDVERVFGQIVFARDMLSSHLPHQYDRVLHELL